MSLLHENRRTIVLGLLAVLLVGYTYATTPERKSLNITEQKTERPIFAFSADRVTQIDIMFNGQHLAGQRSAEGWKRMPDGELLPSATIDDFLASITQLVNLGEVEGGAEQLSEYGLKPPTSQVSLKVEGEGLRTLALGKHNPVNTSLYAQLNESPQIILVGSVVSWDLRKLWDAINNAPNNAG